MLIDQYNQYNNIIINFTNTYSGRPMETHGDPWVITFYACGVLTFYMKFLHKIARFVQGLIHVSSCYKKTYIYVVHNDWTLNRSVDLFLTNKSYWQWSRNKCLKFELHWWHAITNFKKFIHSTLRKANWYASSVEVDRHSKENHIRASITINYVIQIDNPVYSYGHW